MPLDWDRYHAEPRLMGRYPWDELGTQNWQQGGLYDHLLWVLSAGTAVLETAAGSAPIAPGTCVWLKPGLAFSVRRTGGPLVNYAVVFALRDRRGRDLPPGAALPAEVLREPEPGFAMAIMQRLQALASGPGEQHRTAFVGPARTAAEHLLTGLLMELDRANDAGAAPAALDGMLAAVHELTRVIAADPGAAPTVAAQARRLGISPTHLHRLYRQVVGVGPRRYRLRFLLRHARRLLLETDLGVGEIGERLGYSSLAWFSRQFKEQVGIAPSAFRREQRASAGTTTT